jgi:ABC-type uncharacterized transport system YnjBCD substrate-binding protein
MIVSEEPKDDRVCVECGKPFKTYYNNLRFWLYEPPTYADIDKPMHAQCYNMAMLWKRTETQFQALGLLPHAR